MIALPMNRLAFAGSLLRREFCLTFEGLMLGQIDRINGNSLLSETVGVSRWNSSAKEIPCSKIQAADGASQSDRGIERPATRYLQPRRPITKRSRHRPDLVLRLVRGHARPVAIKGRLING